MVRTSRIWLGRCASAVGVLLTSCSTSPSCGPTAGVVSRVIDGDTVELTSGETVRYLLLDAPEATGSQHECFGAEASDFNRSLVEGQEVELRYDRECTDHYARLLAYVWVHGREVNSILVEAGYACALHIPPNGAERWREFRVLEAGAQTRRRGLWGSCSVKPCR
jgi:micrococcal nuclease